MERLVQPVEVKTSAESDLAPTPFRHRRREGISFEDVKKAADKLLAEGFAASLRGVRAELGNTGSLSTISKHLDTLRANQRPATNGAPSSLSPQVASALAADIDRVVRERTSQADANLKDSKASMELLLEENETLQLAAGETEALLEAARASLGEQTGTVSEMRAQLQALSGQLATSTTEGEAARQALALSREQQHASEERCSHLESELRDARQEVLSTRRELTVARQETEAARGAAAALQAQLASKQQVEDYLKDAAAKSQRHQQDLEDARLRLSALEVERTSLSERLSEAKQGLVRAEANVQQLLEKLLSGTLPIEHPAVART